MKILIWLVIGVSIAALSVSPSQAETKSKRVAAAASAPPPAPKQLPIAATDEAKDAVKALRSIEALVSSGVNFRDYSKEVASLTAVLTALDEVLEERKADLIRTQVAEVLRPYQASKELWSVCVTSRECYKGLILLNSGPLSKAIEVYLEDYPAANMPVENGGAVLNIAGRQVVWNILLKAMWQVAGEKGKVLRSSLRPE